MTKAIGIAIGLLMFVVLGTANSGGYRFGVSDQAFYVPAVALGSDASLFPRDTAVLEPQMRLWLGDELLGAVVRATDVPLPWLFGGLYLGTMVGLALAAAYFGRRLGLDWWAIVAFLVLLTLRHRIARTGANSLEGYMHPRMLAFACGLVALACTARVRPVAAACWIALAALVHSSTAIWFAGVVAVAAWWPHRAAPRGRVVAVTGVAVALACVGWAMLQMPRMTPAWLAVLGDRDYLFSARWPLYAWVSNLAYPAVILAIARRRFSIGAHAPGEAALVAGLLALVAAFLVTIPLAEMRLTFFVQLQANRVFWVLDAVVAAYVAWWLIDDVAGRWPAARRIAVVGLLAVLSIGRGAFVLHDTARPLAKLDLPDDDWIQAMRWLRTQPASWHVLADPGHAYKYGSSVRVAALRDTPLELGKDPAMAMYDEALATRVADRTAALGRFDDWRTVEEVRAAASRYALDVFVDHTDRSFALPVLYRNRTFVVYDLRCPC